MRCLKAKRNFISFAEILDNYVYEYRYTIHSTTKKKPTEIFFGRRVIPDHAQFEKAREKYILKLRQKQVKDRTYHSSSQKKYLKPN